MTSEIKIGRFNFNVNIPKPKKPKKWKELFLYSVINSHTDEILMQSTYSQVNVITTHCKSCIQVLEDRVQKVVILKLVLGPWKSGGCRNNLVVVGYLR